MCEKTLILNITVVSDGRRNENYGLFINEQGRIADVFSMEDYDCSRYGEAEKYELEGELVTPGLIDTHIHGISGYATDDGSVESILGMSDALGKCGVTGFFPTLYCGTPDKMNREASVIADAVGHEKGARIEGIHFEGPFLSSAKAGAQDKSSISETNPEAFNSFIKSSRGLMKTITIAPEVGSYKEIADIAKKQGIILSMGHTNASYDQARLAIDAGFGNCTHMFNAMSGLNHRNPGVAGACLFDDRISCEIISDGVHVNRDLVRFIINSKPDDKVILITDSLKPASLGSGTYTVNGDEVILSEDGAFVMKDNPSTLCGSALTLNIAIRNVNSWGISLEHSFRMATRNPSRLYDLKDIGSISKGFKANIVIWNNDLTARKTMINGNWLDI